MGPRAAARAARRADRRARWRPRHTGTDTVRLKFPANYAIPAHSHPTDEHVVIVRGALTFGMGDKLTKTASGNKTLGVGGFALMPANMNHFAFTTAAETEISTARARSISSM